jgi:aromatic-L-amino-acid decarboxylase
VLRSYGVEGFRKHLRNGIEVATHLEGLIMQSSDYEIVAPRSLALIVFRLRPAGQELSPSELNDLNRKFNEALAERTDLLLTQTMLPGEDGGEGVFCIRFAIGAERTRSEHVDKAWAIVQEVGHRVMK